MAGFFETGQAALLVLAVIAAEAALLLILRWLGVRPVFSLLLPGACLTAAIWTTASGKPWFWTALLLALSFVFHLADLRERVRLAKAARSGAEGPDR
ncbi:MAG: hypothetical protein ACMVY4_11115 [Minwuia sp.]|uniref:hypothetical protein n=1 Tax=Minwuia sp. TaxID=2493630 RepID=UPI003A84D75B